jgi:mannose-6-phosphate isomerase
MYRLDNATRAYHWGSPDDIPTFLGQPSADEPVAEVWMGTHPLAPSSALLDDGTRVSLAELCGDLPFLFKILAAARPLSLQVHPSSTLALAGFEAEQARGVPLDHPERTYKDPRHKPEMAYALTTFDTLVGFRPTAEILRIFGGIDTPLAARLVDDLRAEPGFAGIVRLVERVLTQQVPSAEIVDLVAACRELAGQGIDIKRAYATAVWVAEHYPDDPGVVISLMLNRLTLQPGEAAFLDTGVIHAHLGGMCLEIMASSDNVLRAGLTSKPLDIAGLVTCLDGGMSRVARVTPELFGEHTDVFDPDVREFALAVSQCSKAAPEGTTLPDADHRIIVCTGGVVELVNVHGERQTLARGAAVYAGPDDGLLRAVGTGEVAQAYAPRAGGHHGALVDLV